MRHISIDNAVLGRENAAMFCRTSAVEYLLGTRMKTELDTGHTWFLESLTYCDVLELVVVEGFRNPDSETLFIGGKTIEDVHRLEPTPQSRRFAVRFPQFVTWQVVNESFSVFDKSEKRDDTGFLQTLESSSYFSYAKANHGWFEDVVGPGKHYRVWTENEVVDVIACEAPTVELMPRKPPQPTATGG